MAENISCERRRFLGTAAMTLAAARLGLMGVAAAQAGTPTPAELPAIKPGTHTSFGALRQIDAGVLNSDTRRLAPPMVRRSSCCTAGPMTSTAMSTWRRCWRRPATG
jgi:hypothetical protein